MLNFLKQGKGVAGIHAASDNFYKWKAAARMVGGQFDGHPWNAGGTWSFKLNDPKHTLNRAFRVRVFGLRMRFINTSRERLLGKMKFVF